MVSSKIKKKGKRGILNLTSAPKFGDDNPIPKAKKILNKRQNTKKGSPVILFSVVIGFRMVKIAIVSSNSAVFSSAENNITMLFT